MVTISRVSSAAFDAVKERPRQPSARELRRQGLEKALARAIRGAAQDGGRIAYRLILERDDKASTVKAAFGRVKQAEGVVDVNLLTVGNALYVAQRPQRRGRRTRAATA